MDRSLGYFERIASVSSGILDAVSGKPASAQLRDYLRLVEEISRRLVEIHDNVVDVAIRTASVDGLDKAEQVLEELDRGYLEQSFRIRGWCDDLERLGSQLQPLPPQVAQLLTPEDRESWEEFSIVLQHREGEVAVLYDETLFELRSLPATVSNLSTLQARIDEFTGRLVAQKAKFDLVAKKARAIRESLR